MKRDIGRVRMAAFAALGVMVWGAATARAGSPLAERLPADTQVYVGWAGTDALKGAYEKSNLKGVMDASTLPGWAMEQIPKMIGEQSGNADAKGVAEDVHAIVEMALKHPVTYAFLGVQAMPGKDILPQVVAMVDAGTDADALLDKVNGLLAKNKNKANPDGPPLAARKIGTLVVLTVGNLTDAQNAAIDGKPGAPTLAASAEFAVAMKETDESAIVFYADGPKLISAIETLNSSDQMTGAEDKQKVKDVIDALGVRGLTQIAYGGGFDGAEWTEKTVIGMGPERKGLLAALAAKPLGDEVLKAVPKDALMMSISRLDIPAVVAQAKELLGKMDPASLKQVNQGLAAANLMMGVDLEKGLIDTLGDTFLIYRLPAAVPGPFVAMMPLKDGKTLAETLSALAIKLQAMAPANITLTQETRGDATVWSAAAQGVQVAVAVKGNWLVITTLPGVDGALGQLNAKTSILDNPTFAAMRKGFAAGAPTALDFGDPKAIYEENEPGLKMVAGIVTMQSGIAIPDGAIPDAAKIAGFLTPGMNVSWVDAAGYHSSGKMAFPGAGMMTGQQAMSPAVGAVAAAVMLPALGRAREMANRATESANETGILKSAIVFAADNNDNMPEHLAQLIANGSLSPKELVTKRSGTQPLELTAEQMKAAEKDWHTIEKMVDEHCDFVYVGKGTKDDIDSASILLYIKPSLHLPEGINVGFADAHVEWIQLAGLKALFTQNNDLRKQRKVPELKLDDAGMPPAIAP